jgi:hypothetical protein
MNNTKLKWGKEGSRKSEVRSWKINSDCGLRIADCGLRIADFVRRLADRASDSVLSDRVAEPASVPIAHGRTVSHRDKSINKIRLFTDPNEPLYVGQTTWTPKSRLFYLLIRANHF